MSVASYVLGRCAAFAATLALALSPAATGAATQLQKKRLAAVRSITLADTFGAFTPAAADPRAAASFARGGLDASGFRFTPSANKGSKRAVTVAVRARPAIAGDATRLAANNSTIAAITPSAYNIGVSFGWRRFALTGDVARIDTGVLPGGRESADLALSYGGRSWSTRLAVGTDRDVGAVVPAIGREQGYSVDLAGSYALSHNLELTGGMRYRIQSDRTQPLADWRRDSQAVYLGTAFHF